MPQMRRPRLLDVVVRHLFIWLFFFASEASSPCCRVPILRSRIHGSSILHVRFSSSINSGKHQWSRNLFSGMSRRCPDNANHLPVSVILNYNNDDSFTDHSIQKKQCTRRVWMKRVNNARKTVNMSILIRCNLDCTIQLTNNRLKRNHKGCDGFRIRIRIRHSFRNPKSNRYLKSDRVGFKIANCWLNSVNCRLPK